MPAAFGRMGGGADGLIGDDFSVLFFLFLSSVSASVSASVCV